MAETDIQIDMLYMGPGNGCRKILRCDKVGFSEEIDCANELESKRSLIEALEERLFDQFVSGDFTFDSTRQDKARFIIELADGELIDRAFPEDDFEREFTRRELMRRGLFDPDLYRLGLHGDVSAQTQAIDLLKQQAEQSVADQRPARLESKEQ